MKSNISSEVLTMKYSNGISLLQKSQTKKKIKLQINNKYRNKSLNLFSLNNNNLPDISERKWPEDKNDNKTFKNSFASTFYSTNSNNQNFFSENSNEKIPRTNNQLNQKNLILIKAKSFTKNKKKLEINPIYFDTKKNKKK